MFLIPLNQLESVELVVHALRMAGGEADCSTCPVRKVCMKQCLGVAEGIAQMLESNSLPRFGGEESEPLQDLPEDTPPEKPPETPTPAPGGGHLRRIK